MKIPALSATVAVVLAASLTLSACGGGGGGSDSPPEVNNNGNTGTSTGPGSSSTTTADTSASGLTTVEIMGLRSAIAQGSTSAPSTVDSGIRADTDTSTQAGTDTGTGATDTGTQAGIAVPSLSQGAGRSTPTGVSIRIDHLLGPTVIDLESGVTSVAWSDPVRIQTGRYDGFRMTRPGGEITTSGNPPFHTTDGIPETAWVWTDIQDPDYVDFEEVYPLDYDSDSDNTHDSLRITQANVNHVTHIGRLADDLREGDTESVSPVDRGILGQDTTFVMGHRISARFDGAYGLYTCVESSCNINMPFPRDGDLSMNGWVFTPQDETGAGGGTRPPQVPVYDTDYRYFGLWLRGPYDTNQFDIETFAGGTESFTGDVTALTGRATYVGPAGGQYIWDTGDGNPHNGLFTAEITLHADFGAQPRIHGGMDSFRGRNHQELGWDLFFNEAPITGTTFSGTTQANLRGPVQRGRYAGGLYGNEEGSTYPTAAVGTFTGTFDEGLVIGSFGTWRQITNP